ncbi:UDP-GlcNAc--UDP-phosphate GlcNAc-1-phosphate transferase [Mucilaginibacter sp.]|uniref:UDP-GlcNAc--UDP-phosphate GlcNAc-1-phosphate transferase n=1 Tax=Mucilaginibacter sp. TaxID=1882438 RepID=UPI0025F51B4E|nr:UDP-GlcNAc--UDP-phosphate GlcNAc-1-phosphate transferase [Mucilaginibacter sp.]
MIYPILTLVFFLAMLAYFRIADHYNIIDHPNERSSHTEVTIRGGGVIFVFAALIILVLYPEFWLAITGIVIIGAISFLDDRLTLSSRLRLLFHLLAVTCMFCYLNIFQFEPLYIIPLLYIIVIGVVNMYNFMDGINGITGTYSLVVLGGLLYVNQNHILFIKNEMIWIPMLACLVFLFYNFRRKAKCFAGDVGSITIAFWIILLILRLIFVSGNWEYIMFLVVYGIDSVLTIIHRIILKQNIFKAHRLHFYQLMVNEYGMSHLWVAFGYALLQATIICLIIFNNLLTSPVLFCLVIVPLSIVYIILKLLLIKNNRNNLKILQKI